MTKAELFRDVVRTYLQHGWELKSVLLRPQIRDEIMAEEAPLLQGLKIDESSVDALWFSRASHEGREAWELRILAETQYALFENFEVDETEEQRAEMRM